MSALQNTPIVHATTVHPWWDNRVSNKMVNGLAKLGYQVYFIVNSYPADRRPNINCLTIKTLQRESGLKNRIIKNLLVLKRASSIPHKGIFHFHDPEMIFVGALMRLQGWKVIYDVHEDYYLSIAHKPYLGKWSQLLLPWAFRLIEQSFIKLFGFHLINAEKTYTSRYPKGVEILNYPKLLKISATNNRHDYQKINLIYAGVMMIGRGVFKFKEILQTDPDIHITIIGRCPKHLKQQILENCAPYIERLTMHTTPEGIAFEDIVSLYLQGDWAAGISIFSDIPNYRDTEPTKFFEYIQYSMSIIASNFPTWKKFVEGQEIGICIDPDDIPGTLPSALKILKNKQHWNTIRKNCQNVAVQYSWESQQEKLINLYKQIC